MYVTLTSTGMSQSKWEFLVIIFLCVCSIYVRECILTIFIWDSIFSVLQLKIEFYVHACVVDP